MSLLAHAKRKLDSILDDAAAAILEPALKHARTTTTTTGAAAADEEDEGAAAKGAPRACAIAAAGMGVTPLDADPDSDERASAGGWVSLRFAPVQICDVCIRYADLRLEIHTHRYVLMQHSTVYRAMIDALVADKTDRIELDVSPFTSVAAARSFFHMLYAVQPDSEVVRMTRAMQTTDEKLAMVNLLDHMGCDAIYSHLACVWELQVGQGDSFLLRMPIDERVHVARRYHWTWLLDATVARITEQEARVVQATPVVAAALASRMAAVIFRANQATVHLRQLASRVHALVGTARRSLTHPKLHCRDRPYCDEDHEHETDWLRVTQGDFRDDLWAPLRQIDAMACEAMQTLDAAASPPPLPPSLFPSLTAAAAAGP